MTRKNNKNVTENTIKETKKITLVTKKKKIEREIQKKKEKYKNSNENHKILYAQFIFYFLLISLSRNIVFIFIIYCTSNAFFAFFGLPAFRRVEVSNVGIAVFGHWTIFSRIPTAKICLHI